MRSAGKSLRDARTAIDAKYGGGGGQPTPTPMPPA